MPTYARRPIVVEYTVGVYHCIAKASGGPSCVVSIRTLGGTRVTGRSGFSIGCVS
jgi:hypothetical protein